MSDDTDDSTTADDSEEDGETEDGEETTEQDPVVDTDGERFTTNNDEQWIQARCMLIPAGTKILIDNRDAVVSVCHLDAGEADFQALKTMMRSMANGVYFNYKFENRLIEDLLELRDHLYQKNPGDDDRYDDHRNGVGHGLSDLGLE